MGEEDRGSRQLWADGRVYIALGLWLGIRSGGDNARVRGEHRKYWTAMVAVETKKFAKDEFNRCFDRV